jgi:hypothetical protein
MNRPDLDDALSQLAEQPCPEIAPNWQTDVKRRIRSHASVSGSGFNLGDLLMPQLGVGALAAALVVAVAIGATIGWFKPHEAQSLARVPSPMAIFSPEAPELPATLMLSDR